MGLLMGIDLGTSSLKVLLMDERGAQRGLAASGYPLLTPAYGWAEQDPEAWWDACAKCVRRCLAESGIRPEDIAGIGISGQMHGLVALDEKGGVLRPAILHCDTRSAGMVEELRETLGQELIGSRLLNPIFPGFLMVSLAWMRRREPELFRRVRTVLLPGDYLRYRLTGELGSSYSDASASLAFDVAGGEWCGPLLSRLGFDREIFPACGESAATAGTVTRTAAAQTGLRAGTPVAFGGGDQVMQSVGNGVLREGDATVTIGTSGQVLFPRSRPAENPRMNTHTFCALKKDSWLLMGAMLSAGLCMRWAGDLTGEAFTGADALVGGSPPGSRGVLFLPYLNGERTPHMDADLNGALLGLTLRTGRSDVLHAVMEGVCFGLRDCMEACRALGATPVNAVASGGGTNSAVWMQMLSDILGVLLAVSAMPEAAAAGAAITAGAACGVYSDVAEGCAAAVRRRTRGFAPREESSAVYGELYGAYRDACEANRETMHRIAGRLRG